jgi:hypothetical protein
MAVDITNLKPADLVLLYSGNTVGLHFVLASSSELVLVVPAATLGVEAQSFTVRAEAIVAAYSPAASDVSILPTRSVALDLNPIPTPTPVAAPAADVARAQAIDGLQTEIDRLTAIRDAVPATDGS